MFIRHSQVPKPVTDGTFTNFHPSEEREGQATNVRNRPDWLSRFPKFAHLDLAVAHPDLQARLWMHGWPVNHTAIVESKSRGVIWTLNTVPDQLAFSQRRSEE